MLQRTLFARRVNLGEHMMRSNGKCPNCGEVVRQLHYEAVDATTRYGTDNIYKAVALLCPHCSTILGASLSPFTVRDDFNTAAKRVTR